MFTLKDTEKVTVRLTNIRDAKGNPTTPDAPPVWEASDPTITVVTPAADGLSAVIAGGATGTSRVTAKINAGIPGDTEVDIIGDLNIVPGPAAAGEMTFGTPEPQ